MNKKNMLLFLIPLLVILSSFFVAAVPGSWYGRVYINDSLAPNATRVDAFVNGALVDTSYVGQDILISGHYSVVVLGASGDTVTFKVWNVSANEGSQSWGYGDHFLNLTMTTLSNGNTCQFAGACTGGYCVHNICRASSTHCGDSYCDSGETAASCSADCGTVVGSGTSGGNGGLAAATTTPTAEAVTEAAVEEAVAEPKVVETVGETKIEGETIIQTYNQISADSPVTFDVSISDVSVTSVSVDTRTTVKNVEIKITKIDSAPVPAPTGIVYQYFQVDKTNIENSDVERATIKFKVPVSWINENDLQPSEVALKRYTDKWNDLPTTEISRDSDAVHYEANTPGFSYFAIGAREEAPAPSPITGAAIAKKAGEEAKPSSVVWIILGVVFLAVLIAIVVLLTRKKKK